MTTENEPQEAAEDAGTLEKVATEKLNEEVNEEAELSSGESTENIEELPKKEEDFKAKYFYLAAEMENLRKRNERERTNLVKYGNEKVMSSLVDVIDNLDLTLGSLVSEDDEKIKNIVTGVQMIRKQFSDVLEKNGLTTIDSIGKIFDPNFHEAVSQKLDESKEENEILIEYQKGYVLNGRLIRAAKVVVNKLNQ